ncbi:non-specific lipid transfer protein GPI-anchored 8-like [Phoenix dactylifera]|uniref:Non-specific lipid transfer protein GPI-anchored 8-like n=1 Tax=Phoenix dactylifera TaxID=42345 RepID=A0A8B8JCW0_PHODC|nr:non-specific lipid transfer protein GPI-anchored 8-like [Phoenix dactylifera]
MAIRGENGGAAAAVVALAVALLMAAVTGSAQQVPACASKLVPCANYLNSTSPPESCCGPLKQAAKDETACLCSLFNDKTVLQAFKVDIEQALKLAKNCGVDAGTSICSKSNTTATASTPSGSNATTGGPIHDSQTNIVLSML